MKIPIMMNSNNPLEINLITDLDSMSIREKRSFVEDLIRRRSLEKDVMYKCLTDMKVKGRTDIITNLPSVGGWSHTYSLEKRVNKSIADFCENVPLEVVLRNIIRKKTVELTYILRNDANLKMEITIKN